MGISRCILFFPREHLLSENVPGTMQFKSSLGRLKQFDLGIQKPIFLFLLPLTTQVKNTSYYFLHLFLTVSSSLQQWVQSIVCTYEDPLNRYEALKMQSCIKKTVGKEKKNYKETISMSEFQKHKFRMHGYGKITRENVSMPLIKISLKYLLGFYLLTVYVT